MFENHAIKLINRQLSWLTGSLTCLRAFTRFYALLSQLSSLTCLRAFISVKQFTPFTVYSVYSLLRSGLHNQHPLKLVATAPFTPSTIANHFFGARIPSIFLKKMKSYLKTQLCDASSSSMVSQKQKRAFVFKLFLCNPFARSAGIFYALLSQLSNLLRLQFTVYSLQFTPFGI